jgi:hypothetical protein
VLRDVESGIAQCQNLLQRLGSSRATSEEQRQYLLRISQVFSTLIRAAVGGVYGHPFFGSAKTKQGYQKRLRAVVQNTLSEFNDNMHLKGQARAIIEDPMEFSTLSSGQVSRSTYVNEVKNLMRNSRGCELPGTFNPSIIGELSRNSASRGRVLPTRRRTTSSRPSTV